MDICTMTALQLSKKIKQKEISTVEAVEAVFARIEAREEQLHSFLYFNKKQALKQAQAVQKSIDAGELTGKLAGVPVVYKDNLCVPGIPTTCGSQMLKNFIPSYEATAVRKMREAGAICIGKTNMDEFAMGSTTETSAFGITRNPVNTAHVPGGSSGGCAAAVAAGESFMALGTDTGGSIRQPASYCGIVGLKPTYGSVSRFGMIAYGSSLEQIGPMTKDVMDCAALYQVIKGKDDRDATSVDTTVNDRKDILTNQVKGIKIAVITELLGNNLQPEIKEAIQKALKIWESKGAVVEEYSLQLTDYLVPVYYTIASAEASSNLERYDGVKYGYSENPEGMDLHSWYRRNRSQGFGEEVKRRIMLGTFVLSAGYYEDYYLQSCKVRKLITEEYRKVLEKFDAIVSPVAPTTAPLIGGSLKNPLNMYLSDLYTIPANLTGMPAISLPFGTDQKGMPVGVQLMAGWNRENVLFQLGLALEQEGET